MKKIVLSVCVLALGVFFSSPFAKELSPAEGGPTIINSAGYFSGIKKPCQSRATKIELEVELPTGGSGGISGTQVNNAYDCGGGKDFSCQVIGCDNKTLLIFVHVDNG